MTRRRDAILTLGLLQILATLAWPLPSAARSPSVVATSDVPTERGDAARSGIYPGPGPDGKPTLRWRLPTAGAVSATPPAIYAGVWTDPAVVDDTVYAGAADGVLYAADATTGEERWRFDSGDRLGLSAPTVANEVVYVSSGQGPSSRWTPPPAPRVGTPTSETRSMAPRRPPRPSSMASSTSAA